jgi:two-component system sensor kinase FixL
MSSANHDDANEREMVAPRHPLPQLRQDAEAELARAEPAAAPARSAERLLHELQVHQIELEMQNAALRHSQIALEESRNRYADLYESAPVGYLTLTDSGLIDDINLTGATLLGEDRSTLRHSRFARFVAAADRDVFQRCFLDALQHAGTHSCEMSFQRRDGTVFAARLNCLSTALDRPAPNLRITLSDVTRLKQAQDEVRKLSLAVEQSPVSIIITDLDGRIEYVNPAFGTASGYSAAEAIGTSAHLLKSGWMPAEAYANLWATITAGKVWHGEFVNRRKDATEYVETASISPLHQADGRLTHYVAVETDITELRRALDELRTSDDRLRLAKNAAGIGIFDHDIARDEHKWDERMRELWGVGAGAAVSYELFMAGVYPDDRAATQAAVDRAFDPGGSGAYAAEYRVVDQAKGSTRHVAANGQAVFAGGRPVRFTGTVRDISTQKRLEQEMQKRRSEMELLVSQQVAAHTAAAIAHELNQPLVAMSAYSEAAVRMLRNGAKNPEKLRRALEAAVEQAQRAGRTLHELLNFLRQGETAAEAVDLNGVVHDAIAIAAEGGYSGFRPLLDLERDLPPVLANRLQLQKVLVNLLHNGVEAMREAGAAKAAIAVRTAAAGNMAQVTVQDSGPGLDPETAQRIFEPFFTTKSAGIGLGLAISRALIEAHGGQLWADAETGPGARFHFTVPFAS